MQVYCARGLHAVFLIQVPAGPESFSALSQGLRPGLSYVAPAGLDRRKRDEARHILNESWVPESCRALLGWTAEDGCPHVFLISFFYVVRKVRSSWVIGVVAARLKLGPSARPRRLSLLELQIPRFARDDKSK